MFSRLRRSGIVVRRWWRLSGLLFLLSVSLFHLHRLLLVLSLHLLHLSRVGRLLRHALVVLFLLLLKLLVLLLLLRVHLLLALLVFPFPFRICIIRIARVAGRSGSLMRREILRMDRSRRTRNVILWTCAVFILWMRRVSRMRYGCIRRMRRRLIAAPLAVLGWRMVRSSCRLGLHDAVAIKRSRVGSCRNWWPAVVYGSPQLLVGRGSLGVLGLRRN